MNVDAGTMAPTEYVSNRGIFYAQRHVDMRPDMVKSLLSTTAVRLTLTLETTRDILALL